MSAKTLEIRSDVWKDAHRILRRKTAEPKTSDTIYTFTTGFIGGIEIDIKVCNGDGPFVDPVLFENGSEIGCGEVSDSLKSTFMFEHEIEGITHINSVSLKCSRDAEFNCQRETEYREVQA